MLRSIATVSLGGTLMEKLNAIAAAGFDGVEIFENDLLYFDGPPSEVKRISSDLGLRVLLFQPFRDFEAAPRARMQKNFVRAEAKFDIMEQLGCDLMLVCSNTAPDAIDDDAVAAEDLRGLGARAAQRGFRIGYEALAWGRNVKTFGHVWKIVQKADHPAVGMIVDSFHTFAIDDDDAPVAPVPRVFASPPPPVCHGIEFIEFAVDHDTRPRLADMFAAMGFAHVGTHRSKDVTLHRQGDVNLILNAEKDAFAHSFFLLHGPSVCALAFRLDDARGAIERALHYKAQTFRGRVGPNELVIPAIRGLDGSLIYLVDRAGAAGTIYDVDFIAEPASAAGAACGLTRIDHVSQVMPRGSLDGT